MRKIIVISFILLIISCKDKTLSDKPNNKTVSSKGSIEFQFIFPDTVFVNKYYDGQINFKGIFDTITTNVMKPVDGKDRYVLYSFTKTKNINYNFQTLKKTKLDTFGAINNRTILFDSIIFNKIGTYYIDGILNDHVTIDTLKRPAKHTDKVRYLEKEVRATHKVEVIADK